MNWILIDKSKTVQPPSGTYKDWKNILREEGVYQCVYCAINESRFGGLRNFHVEHYRPKKKFIHLVNSIGNLFYICAICNSFKGSDWPAEPMPDWSNVAFPDPSATNYSEYLSVDSLNLVASDSVAGKYIIERLYLNRLQLVKARALDYALRNIDYLMDKISLHLPSVDVEAKARLVDLLMDAMAVLAKLPHVRPYEPDDVRR